MPTAVFSGRFVRDSAWCSQQSAVTNRGRPMSEGARPAAIEALWEPSRFETQRVSNRERRMELAQVGAPSWLKLLQSALASRSRIAGDR